MSIDYFSDLEFVCHGELSRSGTLTFRDDFDYWGIQFSRRGAFRLEINQQTPEYTAGAGVFVTYPGAGFLYGAADPAEGLENKIYICFRGERVKRYLAGGLLEERSANALMQPPDPDGFMRQMRLIRTLLMLPPSPVNHARAVMALEALLLDMRTAAEFQQSGRTGDRYEKFASLTARIAAAPELAWDFEKEARKLAVSYPHFRRLFEQFFRVPPGKFLLSARLEKAAALLTGSDLQIREVALECGFDDEFYFSRIFKKYRRLPPKQYRNNFR